jgi:ribosome-associated toxin RatA of RatAB toxin-antitoxin module
MFVDDKRISENEFKALLEIDFKVFKDKYISHVIIEETDKIFKVDSFSNNNSIFKSLNSSWKIYKPGKEGNLFNHTPPFTNKNPFLTKKKRQMINENFQDQMTFIDYQISFEFNNSMYNFFSKTVTELISTMTLQSMINRTRKTQLSLIPESSNNCLLFPAVNNISEANGLKEKEGENVKKMIEEMLIQSNLLTFNEIATFWQMYDNNRAFRERMISLLEFYDNPKNLYFMYNDIRRLFDDFKVEN